MKVHFAANYFISLPCRCLALGRTKGWMSPENRAQSDGRAQWIKCLKLFKELQHGFAQTNGNVSSSRVGSKTPTAWKDTVRETMWWCLSLPSGEKTNHRTFWKSLQWFSSFLYYLFSVYLVLQVMKEETFTVVPVNFLVWLCNELWPSSAAIRVTGKSIVALIAS